VNAVPFGPHSQAFHILLLDAAQQVIHVRRLERVRYGSDAKRVGRWDPFLGFSAIPTLLIKLEWK
jgi:hypothetical protein